MASTPPSRSRTESEYDSDSGEDQDSRCGYIKPNVCQSPITQCHHREDASSQSSADESDTQSDELKSSTDDTKDAKRPDILELRADSRHLAYAFRQQVMADASVLNDEAKEYAEVIQQMITTMYGLEEPKDASLKQNLDTSFSIQELFRDKLRRVKVGERVSAKKRDEALALKDQGNTYVSNGLFEDAVLQYNKAEALDPSNPAIYCNRAAAYTKLWMPWEAVSDCAVALNLEPAYTKAIGRLGCAYARLSHVDLSELCYKKAVEQDPTNSTYTGNLEVLQKHKQDEANGELNQSNIAESIAAFAGLKEIFDLESIPLLTREGDDNEAQSSDVLQTLVASLCEQQLKNPNT